MKVFCDIHLHYLHWEGKDGSPRMSYIVTEFHVVITTDHTPKKKKKKLSQAFSALKERIGKKMQGWKKQLLSLARREVLLKAEEL